MLVLMNICFQELLMVAFLSRVERYCFHSDKKHRRCPGFDGLCCSSMRFVSFCQMHFGSFCQVRFTPQPTYTPIVSPKPVTVLETTCFVVS